MAISRQKEARSRDYALLLFRMTSRVLYSAQYHRKHCTLRAFEQFGALYMHNHNVMKHFLNVFRGGVLSECVLWWSILRKWFVVNHYQNVVSGEALSECVLWWSIICMWAAVTYYLMWFVVRYSLNVVCDCSIISMWFVVKYSLNVDCGEALSAFGLWWTFFWIWFVVKHCLDVVRSRC